MKDAHPELLKRFYQETRSKVTVDECKQQLASKSFPEHLKETVMQTMYAAQDNIKRLRGEQIGMWLALKPDSEGIVKVYNAFIANGGNMQDVKNGMQVIKHEQDKEARARRAAEIAAMPETQRREAIAQERRHREQYMGEPQHHGEKHMFGPKHRRGA